MGIIQYNVCFLVKIAVVGLVFMKSNRSANFYKMVRGGKVIQIGPEAPVADGRIVNSIFLVIKFRVRNFFFVQVDRFEFIPAVEIYNDNPRRLSLKDVKVGENYAMIINSNAGLWGYNLGDTIKFVSTDPYRLVVTGRTKHFISAFGEHVIGEEVEYSILKAAEEEHVHITEFTVAPFVSKNEGKSYHEWFIEFENRPGDISSFANKVEVNLRKKNVYYDDLISGNILSPLKITAVRKNGFIDYMKSIGKLGGQNKVPRLSNDRKIADELVRWSLPAEQVSENN